jgi:hypothetical protein
VSSRRDDPNAAPGGSPERRWRPEPEVGPASGGHLAPDVHATGPLFEDVQPPSRSSRDRTQAMPGVERSSRGRTAAAGRPRRQRVPVRRVKRTLRHIDPLSVFKLSLFFYAIGVVVWLIFVAILYSVVNSTGIFDAIESFSRGLALGWRVEIDLWFVERWALLIGVIFWLIGALTNLLISFLYNVGADTIGGVEMTFVERDERDS